MECEVHVAGKDIGSIHRNEESEVLTALKGILVKINSQWNL